MLAGAEALALGLGTAYAVWGYRTVRFLRQRWQRIAVFTALIWHMTNWALHDGFHQVAGVNLRMILFIEYGFHMTLIASTAAIIASLIFHVKHSYN